MAIYENATNLLLIICSYIKSSLPNLLICSYQLFMYSKILSLGGTYLLLYSVLQNYKNVRGPYERHWCAAHSPQAVD
jgi:hypothetical protein